MRQLTGTKLDWLQRDYTQTYGINYQDTLPL